MFTPCDARYKVKAYMDTKCTLKDHMYRVASQLHQTCQNIRRIFPMVLWLPKSVPR